MAQLDEILQTLQTNANPQYMAGVARFSINPKNKLGISIPTLRKLAIRYKLNQIVKCNPSLQKRAAKVAKETANLPSKAAHRNAKDTLRQLSKKIFLQRE